VLTAYDPTTSPFANAQVSIDSLPDETPPPGTASFSANVGQCSAGFDSPPVQFAIEQSCQNRGTFPLLVQAVGGQDAGYATLGYLYSNGNALPTDGGVAHVSPTGTWSTTNGSQDVIVTGAPTAAGNGATSFSQIANGVLDEFPDYESGDGTYTFAWQPGYPTSLQSESVVSVSYNDYSNLAVSSIATRTPPPAGLDASTTLDLSTLLPLIDSATVDSSQPGRPSVAWRSHRDPGLDVVRGRGANDHGIVDDRRSADGDEHAGADPACVAWRLRASSGRELRRAGRHRRRGHVPLRVRGAPGAVREHPCDRQSPERGGLSVDRAPLARRWHPPHDDVHHQRRLSRSWRRWRETSKAR
jgi:hypothetical protein